MARDSYHLESNLEMMPRQEGEQNGTDNCHGFNLDDLLLNEESDIDYDGELTALEKDSSSDQERETDGEEVGKEHGEENEQEPQAEEVLADVEEVEADINPPLNQDAKKMEGKSTSVAYVCILMVLMLVACYNVALLWKMVSEKPAMNVNKSNGTSPGVQPASNWKTLSLKEKETLFNPACQHVELLSVDHKSKTFDLIFTVPLFSYDNWVNNRPMQGHLHIKSAQLHENQAYMEEIPPEHPNSIFIWEENCTLNTTQNKLDIHIDHYNEKSNLVHSYNINCVIPRSVLQELGVQMKQQATTSFENKMLLHAALVLLTMACVFLF